MCAFNLGHDQDDAPGRDHDRFTYQVPHTLDQREPGNGDGTARRIETRPGIKAQQRCEAFRLPRWSIQFARSAGREFGWISVRVWYLPPHGSDFSIVDDISKS